MERSSSRHVLTGVGVFGLLVLASAAYAVQPDLHAHSFEITPPTMQHLSLHTPEQIAGDPAAAQYSAILASDLGPGWYVTGWNHYADSPRSVQGPGVLIAPGGLAHATAEQVETLASQFIRDHSASFQTDGSDLVLTRVEHGANRWGVMYEQQVDGIPVEGTQVVLAIHDNGRLFAFGANLYRNNDVATTPTIERPVTNAIARSSVAYDPTLDLPPAEDSTSILPIHIAPGIVEFKLAHITDVPTSEPMAMYRTWVDAHTGDIVYRDNQIEHAYEGSVETDVEIFGYCDGDTPDIPAASMQVFISNVGPATTDMDGNFTKDGDFGSQTATADFNGPDFNVNCSGCTDAQIVLPIEPDTPISFDFTDANSRPDERDAFYFANQTKFYIEEIDPAFTIPKHTVWVNIDDTCNATWSTWLMRFFNEGGGCGNTGRIGSVVAHEFGHGVQHQNLGGGQGPQGLGEGNADIMATFITDDPVIGKGFTINICNSGIRNCDNTLQYPDDLGGGIHSEGRIICGFSWDVREELEISLGDVAGKAKAAELWHFARKLFMNAGNNQPDQVERYRWVDDDNGDLNDGTPHWDEICTGAELHGFSCPVNPNRADITHTPLGDTADLGPFTISADVETFELGAPITADIHEIQYSLNGGALVTVPMSNVGGNTWEADIPAVPANTAVGYLIRVAHPGGGIEEIDPRGLNALHIFAAGTFTPQFSHDMESDHGYTVSGDATDGAWELDDPNKTGAFLPWQPEDDHTASGTDCWITGNPPAGSPEDVEELDGQTILTSDIIDLSGVNMLEGSFWYWTRMTIPGPDSYLELQYSSDNGNNWTSVSTVFSSGFAWAEEPFRLTPWDVDFTSQARFRFIAEDIDTFNMEALVDDFFTSSLAGAAQSIDDTLAETAPLSYRLGRAKPNPFNPSTTISYTVPDRGNVTLNVYDVRGRMIRTLVDQVRTAGEHAVTWDGTADNGSAVASGIYYYKLQVGDWSDTQSMVLLK